MDILYTLRNCNVCEELAYSLRTLCNLPHEYIFFVGGFPNNIKRSDIVYIPTAQTSTKWKNSTQNLKIACLDERLSDDFIFMNDDFFILKPIESLSFNYGPVKEVYERYQRIYSSETNYMRGMRETADFLKKLGISDPLSFELHLPMIMNKSKVLEMFKLPGVSSISVLHKRTLYGNLYIKDSHYHQDVKVSLRTPFDFSMCDDFLSSSDISWAIVKPHLQRLFPQKCLYEF